MEGGLWGRVDGPEDDLGMLVLAYQNTKNNRGERHTRTTLYKQPIRSRGSGRALVAGIGRGRSTRTSRRRAGWSRPPEHSVDTFLRPSNARERPGGGYWLLAHNYPCPPRPTHGVGQTRYLKPEGSGRLALQY